MSTLGPTSAPSTPSAVDACPGGSLVTDGHYAASQAIDRVCTPLHLDHDLASLSAGHRSRASTPHA
uniref:Uncharacterized protein n=1 Tax=Oryza meridionalis TaxID=40149 RepID=A0A0E0E013_9ORYZ